ncbi:nitroreductase family deazaflavin-dependent oxidoreductase [Actinosynnema sp. ALI-1.44]|uniref:nitroreductase family deazaflavin-dependent oxidoreductase n=1 Tax=Actinosynnema sp. ALI-1.44 TaxID=1933779 RepID=UPI00097CAE38|nr:nitroreductase family deazaflavin-dependent oxidoreductase [Actinosynnema sp. ALI-1.44]ONI79802.1 nitroreductase family deazaflavin-dependent oxidoreductase [Actinosynnema sp. ALI-1.44]
MVDIQQAVIRAHHRIYERTDGRLGHKLLGTPTLLLRTVGRRTGQQRTSALVYARDGEAYLVVASNGGGPKAPAWLHNIRANADCEIQVGRDRRAVHAEVVGPGDSRYAALFARCDSNNRGRYSTYQQRTTRPIPIVVLTPA